MFKRRTSPSITPGPFRWSALLPPQLGYLWPIKGCTDTRAPNSTFDDWPRGMLARRETVHIGDGTLQSSAYARHASDLAQMPRRDHAGRRTSAQTPPTEPRIPSGHAFDCRIQTTEPTPAADQEGGRRWFNRKQRQHPASVAFVPTGGGYGQTREPDQRFLPARLNNERTGRSSLGIDSSPGGRNDRRRQRRGGNDEGIKGA